MDAVEMVFRYRGFHGYDCKCGLRIIPLSDGRVAVICSELPDNPGTSVTNFAEELAGLVCAEYGIDRERLVWIEHYLPDNPRHGLRHGRASWDMVTFTSVSDGQRTVFLEPQWCPMCDADWIALGLPLPEAE